MASQTALPLLIGQVFEISFPTFIRRITIRSEPELIVEIIEGDKPTFTDTIAYQAVTIRDCLI